jgi:lysophospholipid acyltransferase (LPLAT)-like uncharacterized protein
MNKNRRIGDDGKRMWKELKRHLLLRVLPPAAYLFLAGLRMTLSIRHVNREGVEEIWSKGGSVISCFWHGRLLAMPFAYKRGKGKVLISRHRDGEFIARIVRHFGLEAIRGSYGKEGAVSSLREMLRAAKKGDDIGITPDGPKGPRYRIKKGILEFARMSGRPIVPVAYGASKKKLFAPGMSLYCPFPFPGSSSFGVVPPILTDLSMKTE